MAIKIFIMGGTIDNIEYDNISNAPKKLNSIVPELLNKSRISLDYDVEEICLKDSRFIDDADRDLLFKKCKQCEGDRIVVTHGTMTMVHTAKYLGNVKLPKTIVLTGSAIPGKESNSDALFNLGLAFAAVQLLHHGVYVAMNGKIFSWENVKKNLSTGFFEPEKQ